MELKINPIVIKECSEKTVFDGDNIIDDFVSVLLKLQFNLHINSDELGLLSIIRLKTNKIIDKDYKLLLPIIDVEKPEPSKVLDDLSWMKKEYCDLFKQTNPNRGGHIKESQKRLDKFLNEFPDLNTSKEEIIEATRLYLKRTDWRYIMMPHYFIIKGSGSDTTYTLLTWIEILRDMNESNKPIESTDITRKLQ